MGWVRRSLGLSFLLLTPPLLAQTTPRRPRGIYAVVNIEENIKKEQAANPSITPAELKSYFVNLYGDLLGNPAVSGLALWVNWDALNPNPPAATNPYDWTYLDDAFGQASAWNVRNPAKVPKTIQLVPLPGFQTPQWLLAQIPSCDGLFRSPVQTPPKTCGKATFAGFVEGRGVRELPMPWNPLYKSSGEIRSFLGTFPSVLKLARSACVTRGARQDCGIQAVGMHICIAHAGGMLHAAGLSAGGGGNLLGHPSVRVKFVKDELNWAPPSTCAAGAANRAVFLDTSFMPSTPRLKRPKLTRAASIPSSWAAFALVPPTVGLAK